MLKKLVDKKNLISVILAVVLLALWLVTLVLGNAEDKVIVLILTPVFPFVVYGFARLMFKLIKIKAPAKVMKFFVCFFLIVSTVVIALDIIGFISGFPNGLSPSVGAFMGLMVAVLDEAKKFFALDEQK